MERHIQSAILAVVIALLLWVGNSITDVGKSIVVLQTQMASVSQQMVGMYRSSEAQRDREDTTAALNDVRTRLHWLEEQHRTERKR